MTAPASMLLEPSEEEEEMLRDAVRGIASDYGAACMRVCIAVLEELHLGLLHPRRRRHRWGEPRVAAGRP